MKNKYLSIALGSLLFIACEKQPQWSEEALTDGVQIIHIEKGPSLAYSTSSGVSILIENGYPFKDLNKNGVVDPYEDWRLPVSDRASDLASKMSAEQIAGLMLYSGHQNVPAGSNGFARGTYNGTSFEESGVQAFDLSDQQKKFLTEDNLRHVLVVGVESPAVAAKWNNKVQSLVEGLGLGIPSNNSSDPRNGAKADAEYNGGSGGVISQWPEEIGLSATFDPAITEQFGSIASQEYRALGIATALSPQIDLATEPRWNRFYGTFGGDPTLATDMARAYVDGFQSTGDRGGWGNQSVNAMVKHWPSGGAEEGGRDGHWSYGKYAVYPGGQFDTHMKPFTEGAFKLNGGTQSASAVMPYYTISYDQDTVNGENVGNGFSKYIITDLLRNKFNYDGVVCTDWLITGDPGPNPGVFAGKSWGVEKLTLAERHLKVLEAGGDQFGGNNDAGPVLEAFSMMETKIGKEATRSRIEKSAVRLLTNIFNVGLFENAYLNPETSTATVGNPAFMEAGYNAQLKSIVMLKNKEQLLPIKDSKLTVYVPKRIVPPTVNFFGMMTPGREEMPVNLEILKKYYNVTDNPKEADFAMVFIKSPVSRGYIYEDRKAGGSGYFPISLQLGDYTATTSKEIAITANTVDENDPEIMNRSYLGKTSRSNSYPDLQTIQDTRKAMGDKPIILSISFTNPSVLSEIEPLVDGILVDFGVQTDALMEMVSGTKEPSGLLPAQMPIDMATVEKQLEDVPLDMIPYVDSDGNTYDFAFGLNFSGVIKDHRTEKYGH